MQEQSWEVSVQRAQKPIVFHFMVCPHSPRSGVLLNEYGEPVFTDYARVDWKGLAKNAHQLIADDVPNSVKLYVADDGVDVMDMMNICTETGRPVQGKGNFNDRINSTLDQLSMTDMRAGITKIAGRYPAFHANYPSDGLRSPLGVVIVSLKFANAMQAFDHIFYATEKLFGKSVILLDGMQTHSKPTTGVMPAYLANWLSSQFGVVYADRCTVCLAGRTYSV
ncbi:TPA: hypothetical protein OUK43_000386 [Pseudomonas aeruginosa]|nr:hypothetical protein [Pseudomonas aeruginosa]